MADNDTQLHRLVQEALSEWARDNHQTDNGRDFPALVTWLSTAPAASSEEQEALGKLLKYARRHSLDSEQSQVLDKCLLMIFRSSAGHFLENPNSNARCLNMMTDIAGFLPYNTKTDLGGNETTLTEHLNIARALGALRQAGEAALGSDKERQAVEALLDALQEGLDFDFAGEPFSQYTRLALMKIAAANAVRGSSRTAKLVAKRLGS